MTKLRLFVVPHTHFDAEVFITRDETLKWASDNLLDVLYLLEREPSYRFTLDQRSYVEGFATLYPEQMARLNEHIVSGRVQLAGGMHAMPDANIPSGEAFVRQILYGRAYESTLGTHDTTGWMIDSFGHHPQIPQLMVKAGFDTYVFQRGVSRHEQAAFWWVGTGRLAATRRMVAL
jgi:alpha-mannosidase